MANRKLSIGCVLILGGAISNCGGVVETRSDDDGTEHAGASGSGFIGAGAGPVGLPGSGGSFGTIAGGAPGTFVGVSGCCIGIGGATGTRPIEMDVGAGAGGASAGDGNWGGGDSAGDGNSAGDGAVGTAPVARDHG